MKGEFDEVFKELDIKTDPSDEDNAYRSWNNSCEDDLPKLADELSMRYLFKSYSWSSYSEIMLSGEYFIAVSLAFLKDLENLLKKVVRAL